MRQSVEAGGGGEVDCICDGLHANVQNTHTMQSHAKEIHTHADYVEESFIVLVRFFLHGFATTRLCEVRSL